MSAEDIARTARVPAPVGAMPGRPIGGPAAWRGTDIARHPERWEVRLSDAERAEVDAAIERFQASGATMDRIAPTTFALPTLGPRLRRALVGQVLEGIGFALVRGLAIESWSVERAAIAFLGLGSYLGSFRSQNARGHLLGHVRDLGLDIADPGVRYYQTTRGLEFHTDSCDIVGLMCLKTARAGGESRIVSSVTLHDEIARRRPDLLPELFRPFPTDRRGEVPEGCDPWFEIPVFNWHAGRLSTIYAGQYVRSAQANFPQAPRLTPGQLGALALLDELANDPAIHLAMAFRPGDMQFVHNHQTLHARGDFVDWDEPARKRHLLRLWLSPPEARPLPPAYATRYGGIEPGARGGIVTRHTRLTFTTDPT